MRPIVIAAAAALAAGCLGGLKDVPPPPGSYRIEAPSLPAGAPLAAELMVGVGARVTDSRDQLEAVIATGEDAKVLGVHAGHPLVLISGVAYSSAREPLRYSEALYRGDRFRFSVDSSRSPELRIEVRD